MICRGAVDRQHVHHLLLRPHGREDLRLLPGHLGGEVPQVGVVQGELSGRLAALHQQFAQHRAALADELRDVPGVHS